jgi:hypothetical protein
MTDGQNDLKTSSASVERWRSCAELGAGCTGDQCHCTVFFAMHHFM